MILGKTPKQVMSSNSNRIGYIDALRGFTMILVVFQHIYLPNFSPLCMLLITLRMPLFFFVSGYISYRSNQEWGIESYRHRMADKFRRLIIPVVVVGAIYSIAIGSSLHSFITDPYKNGYWFTLSLFEMLALYYTIRLVVARYGSMSSGRMVTYILVGAILIYLLVYDFIEYSYEDILSISRSVQYLPFFALGIFLGHYREAFNRLVDSGYMWIVWGCFALIAMVIFTYQCDVDSYIFVGDSSYSAYVARYAVRFVVGVVGLLSVYGLFRRCRALFDDKRQFKPLQYVGRHTLEVYIFHYFLLINFTSALRPYIVDDVNIVEQIVVGFSVAVVITAGTLLVGYILRRIPFVDYYILAGSNKSGGNRKRAYKLYR